MHARTRLASAFALLVASGAAMAALASSTRSAQDDDLSALDGEWLYVEDRTEGRASEEQGPPMSPMFGLRVEEDAVVLLRGKGAQRREERIALDGSVREVPKANSITRYRGARKGDAVEYEIETVSASDHSRLSLILREFRITPDGLLVRVVVGGADQLALYCHPQDIALPAPARAAIADLEWLAGAWVGEKGEASIEEHWSPPLGGAMLAVSRTVKRGSMTAFEYLRIVERGGGLVYVAQPGGAPPTEFVLTELDIEYAVFENPRHDFPQRIVYELLDEETLSVSIGFARGGRPQLFEFMREDD